MKLLRVITPILVTSSLTFSLLCSDTSSNSSARTDCSSSSSTSSSKSHGAEEKDKKLPDAYMFALAAIDGEANNPSATPTLNEQFCINAANFNGSGLDQFAAFKKAFAENNLAVIQNMLTDGKIKSHEAGMVVWNLHQEQPLLNLQYRWVQAALSKKENPEQENSGQENLTKEDSSLAMAACNPSRKACLKAISDTYPYAVWDAQSELLNRYPHFKKSYISHCLDNGFILPYQRAEPRAILTYLPILHYFLAMRDIKQHEPVQVLADPDYAMIRRLLELGFNPYFKAFSWLNQFSKDKDKDVDAYFFTSTKKPEEGVAFKALLDTYAPNFINDKDEKNTIDMFAPGTKFYRPAEKKE